jgi:hypothetical protein
VTSTERELGYHCINDPPFRFAFRLSPATRYNKDVLVDKGALIGSTVHVVPVEGGLWAVVDPRRHLLTMPSKEAAVEHAKSVAAANQPSQVVLLDEFGRLIPIAHYQLPQYPPPLDNKDGGSVFEAAVKALLIGGLMAAGIAVLGDVVENVDRELERETSKSGRGRKRR